MKSFLTLLFILSSFSAFSEYTRFEDAKVFKFLTISGQPSKATIDTVKKEEFDIVLNLRNPGEFNQYDEKAYAEKLGLTYSNIPFFDKDKKIQKDNITKITRYVEKNKDKKIFIHCSSGNRTAAWLLIHLNKDHKMPLKKAVGIAEDVGLNKEGLKKQVISYIKDNN